MNIVYACSNPTYRLDAPSGYAVHIRELSRGLEQNRCRVTVALASEGSNSISSGGGRPHPLRPFVPATIWGFLKDIRRMQSNRAFFQTSAVRLESKPVDLVYERIDYAGGTLGQLAKSKKVPYVVEVHAPLDSEALELGAVGPLVGFFRGKVKSTLASADGAVVVSGLLRKWLIEQGMKADKIRVVPNGVNLELFSAPIEKELRRKKNELVVGFVGSALSWYGLQELIRAFSEARKTQPMRLVIVGMAGAVVPLREVAAKSGVENDVWFAGAVPHKEIPSWISGMDVCVLAKTRDYTSPIKIFEYGALGKAVIAPRTPAVEEVVQDGTDAILITPGSESELAAALSRLAQSQDLRATLGAMLHARVLRQYGWNHAGAKIRSFFDEIRKTA